MITVASDFQARRDVLASIHQFVRKQEHALGPLLLGSMKRRPKDFANVLTAILYVSALGLRWADSPQDLPSYKTCNRCLNTWRKGGQWRNVLAVVDVELRRWGITLSGLFRNQVNPELSLFQAVSLLLEREERDPQVLWMVLLFVTPQGPSPRMRKNQSKSGASSAPRPAHRSPRTGGRVG